MFVHQINSNECSHRCADALLNLADCDMMFSCTLTLRFCLCLWHHVAWWQWVRSWPRFGAHSVLASTRCVCNCSRNIREWPTHWAPTTQPSFGVRCLPPCNNSTRWPCTARRDKPAWNRSSFWYYVVFLHAFSIVVPTASTDTCNENKQTTPW